MDSAIEAIASQMADPNLACLFRNTLPNCLDTTVYAFTPAERNSSSCVGGGGAAQGDDTFIVTGDINAMWLRDSANQVFPYMRYASSDTQLQAMLRGLVRRQTQQILTDVYANAHNIDRTTGQTPNTGDHTTKPSFLGTTVDAMNPLIFERKYELDSLCAFLKLSSEYYAATQDIAPFDGKWLDAVRLVATTMREQQMGTGESSEGDAYQFQRCTSCDPTDTLMHGVGAPVRRTGLVRSAFRPSDDSTTFQFLVPANAMAVVELRRVRAVAKVVPGVDHALLRELEALAAEIDDALHVHAITNHGKTKDHVFAYEVDGFGNSIHMDDSNVPSLLSLPYLGYTPKGDPVYTATRKLVLSNATNPFFFSGAAASGVGSPHTSYGSIWPMGIIMQALTSDSDDEIAKCLQTLKATTAGRWFMHESFDRDDAGSYTRSWFSWANSLFGELIVQLSVERPHLIFKKAEVGDTDVMV